MNCDLNDESELIREACRGNREALPRLLFAYHVRLRCEIAKMMGPELQQTVTTEDVLQDTYICVHRHISGFQPSTPDAFLAWLKTIARNRIRDVARRENTAKRGGEFQRVGTSSRTAEERAADLIVELSDSGASPSHVAAGQEAVEALRIALAALSDDQRRAVRLHCLEQRPLEETAAAMGKTTGAVRGLIHRAKALLKERLQGSSLWFSKK